MNSNTTRVRTLVQRGLLVSVALVALLAAPTPQARSAAGVNDQPRPASTSAPAGNPSAAIGAATLVLALGLEPEGAPAVEEPTEPAAATGGSGGVLVSNVVMVVNDDGSATLSATFEGGRDATALKGVHVSTDAVELDVASTKMWLPIRPGQQSRAGDASDAGGFVVPRGLAPGRVAHLQFQFDDGSCLALDAQAVHRAGTHDQVFPIDGRQLGPGKHIAANRQCVSRIA